jgi:hypothetical protein
MKTLEPNTSYTFSKFFDLKIEPKDLAESFNYTFARKKLTLPQYSGDLDRLQDIQERIEKLLPYVSLSNESARREALIAPIIFELIYYTKLEINIEYSIKVTDQLQGTFDYFLDASNQVLIVEAKKADLDFGMTQLCAELIALDQWDNTPSTQSHLIGGVTTGKIWEFARLDRSQKQINQGLESYRVPEDIDPLMRILIQALTA